MFDKESIVEKGMKSMIKKALGQKAKSVEMENGKVKTEPSEDFIEQCGSKQKADEKLEEITKNTLGTFTREVATHASDDDAKKLKKELEEL